MTIRTLTSSADLERYQTWLQERSHATLWQSLERKSYIEAINKEVRIYVAEENNQITASALVMIDGTSFGLSTWEIPKGPLWAESTDIAHVHTLLEHIIADAKKNKCLTVYCSCMAPVADLFPALGFTESGRLVHCTHTRILDLTMSDEELLAQMKPKGRYNIKVAQKHGIRVEQTNDIHAWYRLVSETTSRDGFTGLSKQRYQAFLEALEGSFLMLAYTQEGEAIAGLIGAVYGSTGIYYYGASSHAHRALMAPYLLQWEAMQYCRKLGCTHYDLLGIAPPDMPSHPWAGITSFKNKFGGELVEYPPEQMVVLKPVAKKLLELKRRFFK